MAVQINGNYQYGVNAYNSQTTSTGKTTDAVEAQTQAQEAAAQAEEATAKQDGFVKTPSTEYKPDMDKIYSMKASMSKNMSAFQTMVMNLAYQQGNKAAVANSQSLKELFENITVDEKTKLDAQQAISEDGEWGVEAVATRIFDFAQALSGGDPEKAETLRKAVEDGFKAAEKLWGGTLPDISQKTYDRVMEKFDEWVNGSKEDVAKEDG